jgi:tungstate transport system substrate-binding protein
LAHYTSRMRFLIALLPLLALTACGDESATRQGPLRLATTTSTHNAGMLDHLLPLFTAETGIEVDVLPVGTGKALRLGEAGDVDVVLVHARAREEAFLSAGFASERRDVMWNDFIILGPTADPAGIRGSATAASALARIHTAKASFVSRGDDSGTHIRELALWKAAGLDPRDHPQSYYEAGAGMGGCLTRADELQAYVLCDRGTWLAYRRTLALEILTEGDPALRNPYGVLVINVARHPHVRAQAARRLASWLTSAAGQAAIGAFHRDGKVLFHPLAADPERNG